MYKAIVIFCISILYSLQLEAQSRNRYPQFFQQYYSDLKLVNPAEAALGSKYMLSAGHQALTGDFNNISTYYANASLWLSGHDTLPRTHGLALSFQGEREGSIFSNSRGYLTYALRLKLSATYHLSVGASLGGVSYVIKSTANSGGGGASNVDARVGISMTGPALKLGFALNQLTNNSLSPIVETLVLRRYGELYGTYTWGLSPSLVLKSMLHTRILPQLPLNPNLTQLCVLNDVIALGLSYTVHRMYGFVVGLETINVAQGQLRSYIAYYVPTATYKVSQNAGMWSVTLSYNY